MPYRNINSTDAWLMRNLPRRDEASPTSLLGAPTASERHTVDGYRLRVLRLMLTLASVAVAAMWYQEDNLELLGPIDRIGYPVLLAVTSMGALSLLFRPDSLSAVVIAVFVSFITYLLSNYYFILIYQGLSAGTSSYMLATLALWLPLGYVAGYVFFSPEVAVRTSLGIYTSISLPQLMLLGNDVHSLGHQITNAMLISHPVYIAALWGVAQLKARARGFHDLARTMSAAATEDPLTCIANRRAMLNALEAVSHALTPDRPLALLLFDVDRFKVINDNFGHDMGDKVLVTLAQQAKEFLRSSDLLGRWGGEEFMILAIDQNDQQAMQMAERLRSELERLTYPFEGTVTVSIGVTLFVPGERIDGFIKRADDALYLAKEQGRNRVEGLFG